MTKRIFLATFVLALTFWVTSTVLADWPVPDSPPPDCNLGPDLCAVPLNTSSAGQVKEGSLFINGLGLLAGGLLLNITQLVDSGNPVSFSTGDILQVQNTAGDAQWVATSTLGLGGDFWERNSAKGHFYPKTLTDNVGIGTNSPSATLEVNGTLKVTPLADPEGKTNAFLCVDKDGVIYRGTSTGCD